MSALTQTSDDLAAAVAAAARSVVAVSGGGRHPQSGTVWRDRIVVTVDHALDRDEDIAIGIDGAAPVRAAIAGRDPSTDLAVLRLEREAGVVSERAPAESIRVGHLVMAVGRAADGPAASMGVLSAVDGAWNTWRGGRVDRFLRADLRLYPGFSGGPLVDASGKTIGINTSGLSRHWSVTLPPATVDRVVDALLSKGRIARGYLGVGLQSVRIPEGVARTLGLARPGGAIVVAVENGSPAERAGIMIGDVVLSLDGAPVEDVEDVLGLLGPDKVGAAVSVDVIRGGARATTRVTVGERASADDDEEHGR